MKKLDKAKIEVRENLLLKLITAYERKQTERAEEVFSHLEQRPVYTSNEQKPYDAFFPALDPGSEQWAVEYEEWESKLNALISKNLDANSIWLFVQVAARADVNAGIELGMQRHAEIESEKARTRARAGAEAVHGKAGASRDKRAQMQAIWASGKYRTKALCAEEEYEGLRMSFSTARKALQKMPTPKKQTRGAS